MCANSDPPPSDTGQLELFDGKLPLLTADEIYEAAGQELLQSLKEDRRIERKPPGVHSRALGDYFSMWANTAPHGGLLVVGMEDDGTIVGCSGLDQSRINEIERAGDVFCPDSRWVCKRVEVTTPDGGIDFLLLFRIFYNPDRVVETVSGKAFRRLGDSKKELSREEIRELQIDKGEVAHEQELTDFSYPEDFDLALVRDFANGVRQQRGLTQKQSEAEILEHRHLGKWESGSFVPNVACVLLFAKDPLPRFPGCKIRFLRFEGEHEGSGETFRPTKDMWIEGPVPRVIAEAEEVVTAQLRDFGRLGPDGKFYTAPEYPHVAWFEAIVNACAHRSYGLRNMPIFVKMFDDRLVIESPGGFPPGVSPENIYEVHHPRNPFLMEALFYLEFVKCANEGTRRMRDEMTGMKLPLPEFEQKSVDHSLVRVTLRNNKQQRRQWVDSDIPEVLGEVMTKVLDQSEIRAVNFVAEHGKINVSQLQRLTGQTWPAAKGTLQRLASLKIFEHVIRPNVDPDTKAHFVMASQISKTKD